MNIAFLLNGESVALREVSPTTTLLDWLRDTRGLTGTKEGCNEGDCGACTVMVTDQAGSRALNACILFLPQLDGKAVRTVEGIAGPDGTLHPVQKAMIDHHASQCGFCTPGFVVSMATAHLNKDTDHDTALAGNLCRCTGYAPIHRAARACETAPVPAWLSQDQSFSGSEIPSGGLAEPERGADSPPPATIAPTTLDGLAKAYAAMPQATLVAGATDVGLWVTKGLRDISPVIFLNKCKPLLQIATEDDTIRFGAGVTMDRVLDSVAPLSPSYAAMIRRYGSAQVRAAATIGGNIANGSPIGDNPPPLIALGARLHLRHGNDRREIALEDFFLDYGKQDRAAGEFVEAISVPKTMTNLRVYKLSKRFDQDISAVCGAFNITVDDGIVTHARIAFGGMAGIPKRARAVEAALAGQPWNETTVKSATGQFETDFSPLSDMRASAVYRLDTARNMLTRYFLERAGQATDLSQVQP